MAQTPDNDFSKNWKQVDAFLEKGLPKSAREEVEKIYAQARAQRLPVQALKAQLYLLENTADDNAEDDDSAAIMGAEKYARTEPFPFNNIWHSIAGTLYREYYDNHHWEILERTRTSVAPTDFEQWDATRLVDAMNEHFLASVDGAEDLKSHPVSDFDPVLQKGKNTRSFRPTLYDLLAFRAVDYFSWEQKDLPKTAGDFRLNDPAVFSVASAFMNHRFQTGDTASPHYNAILLFQEILRTHIGDLLPSGGSKGADAFLDADLQRLEFVNRNAVLPDKKKRYENALDIFIHIHVNHPLTALAQYRLALSKWAVAKEVNENDDHEDDEAPEADTGNALHLKYALEAIVRQAPKSEGGVLAQQYLQGLEQPAIDLTAEEAVLPGKPSKVLFTYRNAPQVWLRVVRLKADFFAAGRRSEEVNADWLQKQKPVLQWRTPLPQSEDLEEHKIEAKVDALPVGVYGIFYSANEAFSGKDNILGYAAFSVTNLALITRSGSSEKAATGYVLHRESGKPITGASVTAFREEWQNGSYIQRETGAAISGADGSFRLPEGNSISALSVKKDGDVFYNRSYYNFYRNRREKEDGERVFFFTDRSIYRPGQSIYFKAIALKQSDYNRKAEVLAEKAVKVVFYDANRQVVATQTLNTNAYGSVTGIFLAPQTGLTGTMQLEAQIEGKSKGSESVQVEEYKRPKFYVQPDSLKDKTFALNETVKLTLKALSYSGAALDGAQVKYRVVRQARIPYWWAWRWGGPSSPQVELTQGTTTTRADGSFDVSFSALPDEKLPEESLPVFSFTVYADVSDANGETHSTQQAISAGYRALELVAGLPEKGLARELDTIQVRTQNLAGNFLPATVNLKITRLQTPDVLYRKRLWAMPDVFGMKEADFRKDFPTDAYKNEDDYHHWKTAETVLQKNFQTTEKGSVPVGDVFSKNGWYVFRFSTKDKNGKAIEQKQFVHVWVGEKAGKPGVPLLVVPQEQTAQPGDAVHVITASGVGAKTVLEQPGGIGAEEVARWVSLGTAPHVWSKTITEADRGGRSLQYLLVRDNRVYEGSAQIAVPWTNKDLNISWETHRDKVQPGAAEEWTLTVRGAQRDKVAAELAAVLYDASLDALAPHQWSALSLFASHYPAVRWSAQGGFGTASESVISYKTAFEIAGYEKEYDALMFLDNGNHYDNPRGRMFSRAKGGVMLESATAPMAVKKAMVVTQEGEANHTVIDGIASIHLSKDKTTPEETKSETKADVPLRKNLQELAFFMPQLSTDADDAVRLKFSFPEALTEWKLMAFAHTKDLKTGTLSGTVKTQKDLMVVPGLPRFFRQGDEMVLSTKITNMTAASMTGNARLEIVDALTGQSLNTQFGLAANSVSFTAKESGSTTATWKLRIPRSRYEPVLVRISASAGAFTDGEENMLPVITNRTLVTETLPLWMNGAGEKKMSWDALLKSGESTTLAQHALTVEYTTNPAWYVVEALPYLLEYPYDCAEQTFNRYYAAALASHILKTAPRVKEILGRWKTEDTAALLSNLEKNQELKSALLAETPWVLEAQSETAQKKGLARLMETAKLAQTMESSAKKLEDLMLPEGAFPWFRGLSPDRYITQYIVTGIGRLQKLGVEDKGGRMENIADECLEYLDKQIAVDYKALLKAKVKLSEQQISPVQVYYLYMRSFFGKLPQTTEAQYYAGQARKFWPKFNAYGKGMIGLFAQRNGDASTASDISKSLLETSNYKEEMGRHWPELGRTWWWWEAPIESQALLIEFFHETAQTSTADEARRWLLKQKQTTRWHTTKATADACYALLRTGTEWLTAEPEVRIELGDRTVSSTQTKTEAGTGYFKTRIPGADVKPQMGEIAFSVSAKKGETLPAAMPTWGSVYWQYFEDYDKVEAAASPLQIRKALWVEEATPRGLVLRALSEGEGIKVGDRVKVRVEIQTDRDLEYVHLKDARAACFEPLNVLSGYQWQGGLGYYQSTRDVSDNFFISFLQKGKYVFEYPLFATQAGDFSAGLATIQCMYAPEFAAHTEGARVVVERR